MKKLLATTTFFLFSFSAFGTEVKPFSKVDFNALLNKPAAAKASTKTARVKSPQPTQQIHQVEKPLAPVQVDCNCAKIEEPLSTVTSGNYFDVDAIAMRTTFLVTQYNIKYSLAGRSMNYPPSNQSTNYGFGLGYKRAFNFNRFFVAPGVFYEYNVTGKTKGRDGVNLENKDRYGVKADFGYDLTKTFSPYFGIGYSTINYNAVSYGQDQSLSTINSSRKGSDSNWFYSVGFKQSLTKNLSMHLEYSSQNFKAKPSIPEGARDYIGNIYFKSKLEVLKLGMSYNF